MSLNPFRRQLPVHSPLTLRAVLASLGAGDPTQDLERTISGIFGVSRTVLLDSGTSALALALRMALERRPGGYCLLPGFGCYDLATAALAAGARVVLYDIEPTTLAPRLDTVLPALTEECAALVIVDQYGIPPALDEILPAAGRMGVMVIEDAAQAAGSTWDGVRIGNRTDAAVLSFGRGKGVTAGGGGALLLSARAAERAGAAWPSLPAPPQGSLAFVAKLAAQYVLARPSVYAVPARLPFLKLGETIFRAPTPAEPMSVAAVRVLVHALGAMDEASATRRAHADRLRREQMRTAPATAIGVEPEATPGWLRLPFLAQPADEIDPSEAGQLGIVRSYPRPLDDLEQLTARRSPGAPLEGCAALSRQLWTLPTHGELSERDLMRLEGWLAARGRERSGS